MDDILRTITKRDIIVQLMKMLRLCIIKETARCEIDDILWTNHRTRHLCSANEIFTHVNITILTTHIFLKNLLNRGLFA